MAKKSIERIAAERIEQLENEYRKIYFSMDRQYLPLSTEMYEVVGRATKVLGNIHCIDENTFVDNQEEAIARLSIKNLRKVIKDSIDAYIVIYGLNAGTEPTEEERAESIAKTQIDTTKAEELLVKCVEVGATLEKEFEKTKGAEIRKLIERITILITLQSANLKIGLQDKVQHYDSYFSDAVLREELHNEYESILARLKELDSDEYKRTLAYINRKIANKKKILQQALEEYRAKHFNYYGGNIPSGRATDTFMGLMSSSGNLEEYQKRKRQYNHGVNDKYRISKSSGKAEYISEGPKDIVKIGNIDIAPLVGSNKGAQKMFMFALGKINEQAVHNNELFKDTVCFPLQELVDIGMYTNIRSARTGFKTASQALTGVTFTRDQKRSKEEWNDGVLFANFKILNNQCQILINKELTWQVIAQGYMQLPAYYYTPSSRASTLLYYVFYLARQNTNELKEKGSFSISFNAIHARLNLPMEGDTDNPKRDIKEDLLSAVEEILDSHEKFCGQTSKNPDEFDLIPHYQEGSISDFLKGSLEVKLTGEIAGPFTEFRKRSDMKIERKAEQRKQLEEAASGPSEEQNQ